jgi:hypothetical protein
MATATATGIETVMKIAMETGMRMETATVRAMEKAKAKVNKYCRGDWPRFVIV